MLRVFDQNISPKTCQLLGLHTFLKKNFEDLPENLPENQRKRIQAVLEKCEGLLFFFIFSTEIKKQIINTVGRAQKLDSDSEDRKLVSKAQDEIPVDQQLTHDFQAASVDKTQVNVNSPEEKNEEGHDGGIFEEKEKERERR